MYHLGLDLRGGKKGGAMRPFDIAIVTAVLMIAWPSTASTPPSLGKFASFDGPYGCQRLCDVAFEAHEDRLIECKNCCESCCKVENITACSSTGTGSDAAWGYHQAYNCFSKRIRNAKGIFKAGSDVAILETCARMPTCPQFTADNPYGRNPPLLQPDLTPVEAEPDYPNVFRIDPGESVRLYSPLYNYPECQYPKETEYKWKVKNNAGFGLTVIRHFLDVIAGHDYRCRLNHLLLINLRGRKRRRMCGRNITTVKSYESRYDFVKVVFTTNNREDRGRGFDLEILAHDS